MKPHETAIVLEDDHGIWNVRWWELGIKKRTCEWPLVACGRQAERWCVECGLAVCERHARGHADSKQHRERMERWGSSTKAKATSQTSQG